MTQQEDSRSDATQLEREKEETTVGYPDWGDWTKAALEKDDPNYYLESIQRAVLHVEHTTMQCKMELKQLGSTTRFLESRSMREKYPADDLVRQLSQGSLSTKCGVLCECLEAKASRASLVSVACCPILACGYVCAFCDAKQGLKEKAKLKAKEKDSKQKTSLSLLSSQVKELQLANAIPTSNLTTALLDGQP